MELLADIEARNESSIITYMGTFLSENDITQCANL